MSIEIENITCPSTKRRRTYHIQNDLHEKVKAYAYWERLSIAEVVNTALKQFFEGLDSRDVSKTFHTQNTASNSYERTGPRG